MEPLTVSPVLQRTATTELHSKATSSLTRALVNVCLLGNPRYISSRDFSGLISNWWQEGGSGRSEEACPA